MSERSTGLRFAPALLAPVLLASVLLALAAAGAVTWHVWAGSRPPERKLDNAEPSAERSEREPVALALEVANMQLGIVRGDIDAFERQSSIADDVARRLRALGPETWQDSRNRQALVKLVLSGSNPEVLDKVVASGAIPAEEALLAQGALAFAMGDRSSAASLLREINHARLAASLAGHVALTKAVLAARSDPAEALALCEEARLLSPGTHVEEAALRLAIELAIKLGDEGRFAASAVNYLLRFHGSVYARSIVPRLARVMGGIDFLDRDRSRRLLAVVHTKLPSEQQALLYLEMAEAALRSGKLTTAVRAGGMVVAVAPAGSAAAAQARALIGAARIAAGELDEGRRELPVGETVPPGSSLRLLVETAGRIADLVSATPEQQVAAAPGRALATARRAPGDGTETQRSPLLTGKVATTVERAKSSMAVSETLIAEVAR